MNHLRLHYKGISNILLQTYVIPHSDPDLDDPQSCAFTKVLAQAMGQLVQQVHQMSTPDPTKYPKAKDLSMFNG